MICSNKNSGAIHVQALIVKLSIGVYCSLLSLLLSRPSLGGHCHWMPQKKLAMDGDFPTDRRVSLSSQLQSTSGISRRRLSGGSDWSASSTTVQGCKQRLLGLRSPSNGACKFCRRTLPHQQIRPMYTLHKPPPNTIPHPHRFVSSCA